MDRLYAATSPPGIYDHPLRQLHNHSFHNVTNVINHRAAQSLLGHENMSLTDCVHEARHDRRTLRVSVFSSNISKINRADEVGLPSAMQQKVITYDICDNIVTPRTINSALARIIRENANNYTKSF